MTKADYERIIQQSRACPTFSTLLMLSHLPQRSTFRLVNHRVFIRAQALSKPTTNLRSGYNLSQIPRASNTRRTYSSTPMAAPTDTQAAEVQNATGITPESMAQTLREKLDASHVDIQDISGGCGQSFAALIVSPQFQGKAALARHRLVNAALKEEIAAIHAWTPKCLTPEQWEKERQKQATI